VPIFWWVAGGCFAGSMAVQLVAIGARKLALVMLMRKLRKLGVSGHLGVPLPERVGVVPGEPQS
jgi:hypothetical protein